MNFIIDIIKGMFIGVANIIPGVSGGTMAVSMGVYDKMVGAINSITTKFRKSIFTLIPLLLGMIIGIVVFSYIIPYSLIHYSFQTVMCFSGLVIGGIPDLMKHTRNALVKEKKYVNPAHIILFVTLFSLAIIMAISEGTPSGSTSITINLSTIIILALLGIIAAATMVIPGISGSLLLMILGYYSKIISTISSFITALKNMDTASILHNVFILLPFGIGCILGILLISKLITWLLKNYESLTYFSILGLVTASPIAILLNMENPNFKIIPIVIGILLFTISTLFTYYFSKKTNETD